MRHILLFAFLCLIGTTVYAEDRGTYLCKSCPVAGPVADGITNGFIRNAVNLVAFPNDPVPRWRQGDTVTICNGSECATYAINVITGAFVEIARRQDNGTGYDNAEDNVAHLFEFGGSCGGYSGGYTLVTMPIWETWRSYTRDSSGRVIGYRDDTYLTGTYSMFVGNGSHSTQVC